MNRNPSSLSPLKIDTVCGVPIVGTPGYVRSKHLARCYFFIKDQCPSKSKDLFLPSEGANKIVTELGGVVKVKIELFYFYLF